MPRVLTDEQKARAKERSRAWTAANRERKRANEKRWIANNPEKRRAIVRKSKAKSGEKYLSKARAYKRKWHAENPEESRRRSKAWRDKNKSLVMTMKLKSAYDIDENTYNAMLKACGGLCAICKKPPNGKRHHGKLHVDHDHQTKVVRGLLCGRCNSAIGLLNDSPILCESAANYLRIGETRS